MPLLLTHLPFLLLLGFTAWRLLQTMLNHDVGYYLQMANALHEGRLLYRTFPDFGLPSNAWLAQFSFELAHAAGLPLVPLHQLVLFGLVLGGLLLTHASLQRLVPHDSLVHAAALPLLSVPFFLLANQSFGQREHLFIVLFAPLALLVAGRHLGLRPPRALSVLTALAGALGCSMKPHLLLPLATLTVGDLCLHRFALRRLAVELWLTAALLTVYFALVLLLYPTYFTRTLPDALVTYRTYGRPFQELLAGALRPISLGFLAILALGTLILRRRHLRLPLHLDLAGLWLGLGLSLVVLYFSQRQGFAYHHLPATMYFLASLLLFVTLLLDSFLPPLGQFARVLTRVAAVGLFVLAALVQQRVAPVATRAQLLASPLFAVLHALPPNTPIFSLQTGVPPIAPSLAYTDLRWTGAMGQLVELPAIVRERDEHRDPPPRLVAIEQDMRARVLLSLTDPQPDVVLVDVTVPLRWLESYGKPFALVDFLQEDPAFTQQWRRYERVTTVQDPVFGLQVEVYRRRDRPELLANFPHR